MSDTTAPTRASELLTLSSSRRDFLRKTALTTLVGGTAAARGIPDSGAQTIRAGDADNSGGTMAPNPVPVSPAAAADAMDKMHEAGIKAFPAKTAGKGNQPLKLRIENGVACASASPWRGGDLHIDSGPEGRGTHVVATVRVEEEAAWATMG